MFNGSNFFDQVTNTSDRFQSSNSSSRGQQGRRLGRPGDRKQQPVVHTRDQLSSTGLGVGANAYGLEEETVDCNTAEFINLNEHYSANDQGELRLQPATAPPWPESFYFDQFGQYPSQGSRLVNQGHAFGGAQQYFVASNEVTLTTNSYADGMYAGNPYLSNSYRSADFLNQIHPMSGYLSSTALSSVHEPNAAMGNIESSYPRGQYESTTSPRSGTFVTNVMFPSSETACGSLPDGYAAKVRRNDTYPYPSTTSTTWQEEVHSYPYPEQPAPLNPVDLHPHSNRSCVSFGVATSVSQSPSKKQLPPGSSKVKSSTTSKIRFHCSYSRCGVSFSRESDLYRHLETLHGNVRYQCRECGRQYSRRDQIEPHCRAKHNHARGHERYCVVRVL